MAWLTLLIKSGILLLLFSLTCIDGLENLALRRPAWEQHPWPYTDKDYGSQNAVDGDYSDRSAAGGQCSISADNNYTEATWGVDLGEVVSISHIDIFYRTDNEKTPTTFTSRMAGFSLYVSNSTSKDDGHLCFHEIQNTVGTPSEDQRIQCPFHARYVIYYNERRPEVVYPSYYSEFAYSDLCEVKVYGCRNPGYFGSDCNLMCPSNCQEKRCNINTGYCLGCRPGYKDQSCKHICEKMTYGLECALNCGECRDGTSCHHVNGTCTHGCADGLYGDMCQKECPIGYHGRNCLQQCSENCYVTSRCDRVTGRCDRGCKSGWTTITCDQKCEIGYYGPDCLTKCGHCLNASFCHHINGSCLNGCSKGFKGEYCKESCPHGYFGIDCVHKCSTYCSGNGSCNRFTGVCDEGCKDGWSGLQCGTRINTECEIGYFGPDCLKKCGHCFNTSQCNLINGTCLNGCSKGYKGKYCKESCAKGYFGKDCVHKCSTYCSGNESCSHITGVCDEGCKDGWSGSKCGTSINPDGLNPIIIGVGSGIGIVIFGVVLYFALSKIRKCKDKDTTMQSCKRAEDLQEKFQPNDSTEELKSVADNSVGTKKSEVDNIDYKRLAIEINKLQVTTRENLTDSHTNPDVPRKHLPRNAQDDTSATHRRNETTKENSIASVETQHLENTAGKSLVPLTARKAIQPTQFSGLTESAGEILKDKPDCDDHPSQSQSEMKQNSPKEHQSRIAMPDKIECLLPRSDGVAPIPTPESDGRDKTQCSAPKSDCHIGMTTIRTPEYDGIKKIRHVKSRCKKVTGNVESENKKKEAEDQKNDKDSKTIQETGNTELLTGCIKVDDFNFKDSPPSPLNSDPKPPNIHKGGTAKPKLDSRTKVRHSAPKSDGFGRKTVRTDRKPLLFHNQ